MSTYEVFKSIFNQYKNHLLTEQEKAEKMLQCYTPDNKEQEYKYNRLSVLKELNDLLQYYYHNTLSYEQTIQLFMVHCNSKVQNCNKEYGIKETYFNELNYLLEFFEECRHIMLSYVNEK